MRRLRYLIALLAACTAFGAQAAGLEDIDWLTEEYAPYNYTEDGEIKGLAVDTLTAMWQRLGVARSASDIRMLPWARAYRIALERPNTCLFSTTVTESRRELFRFVEPIVDTRVAIIAPRASQLQIAGLDALRELPIGVVREDIGELLLQEAGIDGKLQRTDSARALVRMLEGGRFPAVSYSFDTVRWNMRLAGIDASRYENVFTLSESVLGFACHKDTDPTLIQRLQDTLNALHAEGQLAAIHAKYLD